jgi:hypothetical protein
MTIPEPVNLGQALASVSVLQAGGLGADRRHLRSDWPSGQPRRVTWASGTFLVSEVGL